MDFLMILAVILCTLLAASFVGYVCMTNSFIKDQEKRIIKLTAENRKLRNLIHKEVKPAPQVIEIHDHTVEPENVPIYGDN